MTYEPLDFFGGGSAAPKGLLESLGRSEGLREMKRLDETQPRALGPKGRGPGESELEEIGLRKKARVSR